MLAVVRAAAAALAVPLLITACDRSSAPVSRAEVADQDVEVALDSPESAVRSLFACLRAERRAIAVGDKPAQRALREKLGEIAARDALIESYRSQLRGSGNAAAPMVNESLLGDLVDEAVALWGAIAGYYLDGVALDEGVWPDPASDAERVVARIPARGPNDEALIRVTCVRADDGRWHVFGVDFQPPTVGATTQAAVQSRS